MNKNATEQRGRVILTYGRSLMALTAAHSLGARGIEVIGCDDVDWTVLKFSKFTKKYFVHPRYDEAPDAYFEEMNNQIEAHRPDDDRPYILMPMFRDMAFIAEHKNRFPDYITLAVPPHDAVEKVGSKTAFARFCEEHDLATPDFWLPDNEETLQNLKDALPYPVLIKTPEGRGGRGIHKCADFEELETNFKQSKNDYGVPPIIQAMAKGHDYCFTCLCDQGEIVADMSYTNLHTFPKETGAGAMRETVLSEPFFATAQKMMRALQWHGVAEIDFMWEGTDEHDPQLIEVNARFWAGLFHSVQSGIDYPWLLYKLLTGQDITQEDKKDIIGKKTKVPGLWLMSALEDLDNEEGQAALKDGWQALWAQNKERSFQEKWTQFSNILGDTFSTNKEGWQNLFKQAKEARDELDFDEEDPMVAFGILFILNSLLKHGKLPEEVTS